MEFKNHKLKKGFTFIEVLVGIFLILIIFLGIFGAYQLALKIVGLSKNKVTAIAIANQEIEKIRNLPYDVVGIQGASLPIPDGILNSESTIVRNNIEYTVQRKIKYVIDEADGIGEADECDWDYKTVDIKVSWSGMFSGELLLSTVVAPDSEIEEINACTSQPGGILTISVFDAYGKWEGRGAPLIEVFNAQTKQRVDFFEPSDGRHGFPLPIGSYKVKISKTGYSTSETYGIDEVAVPEKPNPLVLQGEVTENSFSIDKVSAFSVDTLSPWGMDAFSDTFEDESQVFAYENLVISGGQVILDMIGEEYQQSGSLASIDIIPVNLVSWIELSWNDTEPALSRIFYHVDYFDGEQWLLVPDSFLSGNAMGLSESPVDLSGLDPAIHQQLRIIAEFYTDDREVSPVLYDWQVSWQNSIATSIPNAPFHLQGEKIIGYDEFEAPVYKYSQDLNSNASGHIDISNLEWDSYTFSIEPGSGLDLVSIEPEIQPIGLTPDTTVPIVLYLDAQNSLFTVIKDAANSEPIFSAEVRLYNSPLSYDKTQYTDEQGETYFIPLEADNYTIEVRGPGYVDYTGTFSVSGDVIKNIGLERTE